MIEPFNFASIPNIIFGPGKLTELYNIIPQFGNNILFVTGASSIKKSGKWDEIIYKMNEMGLNFWNVSVNHEPSPQLIDDITSVFRNKSINLVVAIGGGSVTDAGKAISAMLPKMDSIKNYLEGIGSKHHDGKKVQYIAIPTTSGTGSEATKNAVISEIGPNGFKKSLRHDNLVPNYAIIDPEFMIFCPPSITAACGMDAFTQLLETYVSSKANPMTDSLAYSGMQHIKDAIIPACSTGASDINIRAAMAYGSLMSGITLANAGLGIVHGLASPIGGYFNIPHGIVCGTLLAQSTKKNIQKLEEFGSQGKNFLLKYAKIGSLLNKEEYFKEKGIQQQCSNLITILEKWTSDLKIPRLGTYGITEEDIDKIVEGAALKNNPVYLNKNDIKDIVLNRL
jgi:alcohol dehydrogenase